MILIVLKSDDQRFECTFKEVFDMLKRKKSEGEYELLAVQWIDLIDPAATAINKGEGNVFYMALLRSP